MAKLFINERQYINVGQQGAVNNMLREIALRPSFSNLSRLSLILPNPDPILKNLGKDISTYRDLLSDAHVFSNMMRRKSGVLSMEWEIDRGKSKSRVAKYISDLFADDDFDIYQVMSEILEAPLFGYQPLEVMWHLEPVRAIGKPPEWFIFDQENNLKYRPVNGPAMGVELPDKKFLLARHSATYNNPYGEPALSRCFWPATFKKGGYKFFVIFAEKWGMPFVIGKHRRGEDEAEVERFADMLENMVQDAIAVVPEDAQVELIERSGSGDGTLYTGLMHFSNYEISKALLGHSASADSTPGRLGNENMAETAGEDIIGADRRIVEKTLNQFISWIAEFKFGEGVTPPTFGLYEEEDVDKTLSERDEILGRTGVVFTKKYFQRAYGLEDDEFEVGGTQQPLLSPGEVRFMDHLKALREFQGNPQSEIPNPKSGDGQEQINAFLDALPDEDLQTQIEAVLQPVLMAINDGSNYTEILGQLAELYPEMETGKLEEILARAMFVSEVLGRLNAGEENE